MKEYEFTKNKRKYTVKISEGVAHTSIKVYRGKQIIRDFYIKSLVSNKAIVEIVKKMI